MSVGSVKQRHLSPKSRNQLMLSQQGFEEFPKGLLRNNPNYKYVFLVDVSKNEFTELPDSFFLYFKNLETLIIQSNKLIILSSSISKLKQLKVLKLDNNLLSTLPYSIKELYKLEHLSVSKNTLITVPMSIGGLESTLKILDLSNNVIELLPTEIGKLTKLKILYLDQNRFNTIPFSLANLSNLVEFGLDWIYYTGREVFRVKGDYLKSILETLKILQSKAIIDKRAECNCIEFIKALSNPPFTNIWLEQATSRTWLHIAASYNHLSVISSLANTNINALDKEGYTPLGIAIRYHKSEAAFLLLSLNADVSIGNGPFGTPLHMAVFKSDLNMIIELLGKGADPNAVSPEIANTPLHYLFASFDRCPYRSAAIAERLILGGADPNRKNGKNWASIHIAIKKEQIKAVKWIIMWNSQVTNSSFRFDLDIQGGNENQTPLHLAVRAECSKFVQKLINGGANPFVRNNKFRTPKQSSKRNTGIYKLIFQAEAKLLRSHMKSTSSFAFKENQESEKTQIFFKLIPTSLRQREISLRVHPSLNERAKQDHQSFIGDSFKWERDLLGIGNEHESKSCLSLSVLKEQILDNKLKLYERHNALNNLKKENGPQVAKVFAEVLTNVLSIANYGLQQDVIQLTNRIIFTGIIKVLEQLLSACNNTRISCLLIDALEHIKVSILDNIKHNRNSNDV